MALILSGDTGVPASGMPTGSVIQTVTGTSSTTPSTTGGTYVASGITASITPQFSNSKILVVSSWWQSVSGNGVTIACTLYRNSTDLGNPSFGFTAQYMPSTSGETTASLNYLDSPATTSATTYTIYFKRIDNAGTVYCGSTGRTSTITLLEIKV